MKEKSKSIDVLLDEVIADYECEKTCNLNILNKLSMKLIEPLSEDAIYQTIAEGLHELATDSIIILNSFDKESGLFHIEKIVGDNKFINNLTRILGKSPYKMPMVINSEAQKELSSGSLKKVPGGLYELAMGALSQDICTVICKILNINDIYAIGFNWQGELFGSACILLRNSNNYLNKGSVTAFISMASIALQRSKSDDALSNSEREKGELLQRCDQIIQHSTDMIFQVDLKGNFVTTNDSFIAHLGYSAQELIGLNGFQLVYSDDLNHVQDRFSDLVKGRSIENLQYRYRKKDGSYINILNSSCPIFDKEGQVIGAIGISRNISEIKKTENDLLMRQGTLEKLVEHRTAELQLINEKLLQELAERKRAEEESRLSAEQLNNLMATAPMLIARSDLDTRITYINQKFEEETGYSQSEVIGKYWTTAGVIPPEFVGAMLKRVSERLLGRPPTGMEVPLKCKDGQIKYFKGVGQIIKENGKPVAVQVLAYDITKQKQAEEYGVNSVKRLLKAQEDMIEAMVITMELRDPYTAGHQRRVSKLATAIAKDIGLSDDQLLGIRLAGLVHDIGKIRIPSEILTFPGKLNDAEMLLINMHPAFGYEILKNIDFPWPIAQVVLQHHERLDGSGYPSKLTSDDISIEAKIIAVADVVEAMASHRPYRPALGLDAAFKEIQSRSGKLYEEKIIDSCIKLFKKKGFKFEEVSTDWIV